MGDKHGVDLALSLPTCEETLCNKRGSCVTVDNYMGCDCMLGYQGPNCADTVNKNLSLPLTLGVLSILFACIFLAFLLAHLSRRRKARRR